MEKLTSIKYTIAIILCLNIIISNCYEEFNIEGSYIDSKISKCRLKEDEKTFHCTRTSLLNKYCNTSKEDDKRAHKLNYYAWLISMPVLSPNTVIYNELPPEVDQSELYVNNFIKEPKFSPLYYKIKFNEYYDYFREHLNTHLTTNVSKSRVTHIKDKFNEILGLPKIVIEAKSSHTTSFDEDFSMELYGDDSDKLDEYSKSLLLFLDFYLFRQLNKRAYLLKFLNTFEVGYKLRFYMYCERYSKSFKRYRHILMNEKEMVKLMCLSKYFNIVSGKIQPFIPLPFDDEKNTHLQLSVTTTNKHFHTLMKDITDRGLKNVDFILQVIDKYILNLYKVEELRNLPTLDSFYVLEVVTRSAGFSLYNMFPPAQRKQILDYKDCILVKSHVSKLDSEYFVFQIVNKFIITLPILGTFAVLIIVYILKFIK